MIIRLAQEKDIPAITRIYNEAIETTTATFDTEIKTVDDRKEWFSEHHEKLPVWVCEHEGHVVGWAALSLWSDRCAYSGTVENSVYVLESHRGKGIGKGLMEVLMGCAKEFGYHTIIARVTEGNPGSVQLHERFGFQNIGTMKEVGRKFGKLIDVHMMQKIL